LYIFLTLLFCSYYSFFQRKDEFYSALQYILIQAVQIIQSHGVDFESIQHKDNFLDAWFQDMLSFSFKFNSQTLFHQKLCIKRLNNEWLHNKVVSKLQCFNKPFGCYFRPYFACSKYWILSNGMSIVASAPFGKRCLFNDCNGISTKS
jgi:hypothetical protein